MENKNTLIRDGFIANMQNSEIHKDLLTETVDPAQALRLAIDMELGQWNQLQLINSEPTVQLNAIIQQRKFRYSNQRLNFQAQTRQANELCRNCGLTWSTN